MPFNGSGGFISLSPPDFPAVPNTTILSDQFNNSLNDIFLGLGNCVTRDGQSPATANLPMGGNKHTGAAAGSATGEYLTYGQTSSSLVNLTLTGNLTVEGNTTLGNASGDTLTVAPNAVTWSNNPTHSGNHTWSGVTVMSVNSASTALRITQLGAGDALVVEDSTNPDSTPFKVDASGTVMAGISTPYATLGTVNIAVPGASQGAITSNTGTTSARTHWRLAVSDVEVGGIGTAGSDITLLAGGSERMRWAGADGTVTMSGKLGIGSSSLANLRMRLVGDITGGTTAYGLFAGNLVVKSDVTGRASVFASSPTTEAASFTVATLSHFYAVPGAFGAGSTVTNQMGFEAPTNLTGATNNYGFYGNIPDAAGRWNFYAAGTAPNWFTGVTNVGLLTNVPAFSGTDLLRVGSNTATGNGGMVVNAGANTASSYLYFSDPDSRDVGGFLYDHNNDSLAIRTAGATRLSLTSAAMTVVPAAVTWSGNPTHSGNHIFSGNVTVEGNTVIGNASTDTLTVAPNAVTWSNNPTHSGNHIFSGNLTVEGNTVIGNASGDTLTVAPNAVTWSNNPTHSGNHTFSGNLTVNGNTTIGNASGDTLTVAPSAVTWSNNPTHSGNHTFSGTIAINASVATGFNTMFQGGLAQYPTINFDTNDYFEYDRTNNRFGWRIASTERLFLSAAEVAAFQQAPTNVFALGYLGIPMNTTNASSSFALNEAGCARRKTDTSAYTYTIPLDSSVAFPVGTVLTIVNDGTAGTITVARAGGVTLLNSSGTNADRSVAANSTATLVKLAADRWRIYGEYA